KADLKPDLPGLIGYYPLDQPEGAIGATLLQPLKPSVLQEIEKGPRKHATQRSGDGAISVLENLADAKNPGSTPPANILVPGKFGQALRLTGDDGVAFPKIGGGFDRGQTFSISFWLQTPQMQRQGIVFHRQSGTDTGFHGTELSFDEGRLFFGLIRFWPGNAI